MSSKEKKRRPGGPVTSEKCLWARFVKTCYFEGTMFTQRNTYWESDCAGRIWNCSFFPHHHYPTLISHNNWLHRTGSRLFELSYLRIVCFISYKLAYTSLFLISPGCTNCFQALNTHTHTPTQSLSLFGSAQRAMSTRLLQCQVWYKAAPRQATCPSTGGANLGIHR